MVVAVRDQKSAMKWASILRTVKTEADHWSVRYYSSADREWFLYRDSQREAPKKQPRLDLSGTDFTVPKSTVSS